MRESVFWVELVGPWLLLLRPPSLEQVQTTRLTWHVRCLRLNIHLAVNCGVPHKRHARVAQNKVSLCRMCLPASGDLASIPTDQLLRTCCGNMSCLCVRTLCVDYSLVYVNVCSGCGLPLILGRPQEVAKRYGMHKPCDLRT